MGRKTRSARLRKARKKFDNVRLLRDDPFYPWRLEVYCRKNHFYSSYCFVADNRREAEEIAIKELNHMSRAL